MNAKKQIRGYNCLVRPKNLLTWFLILAFLTSSLLLTQKASAASLAAPLRDGGASAGELIAAMNSLRVSNGLPALIEDSIIDAVAQGTAEIMAANEMSWHIGDVSGRIAAAGYGGGSKVWATENFAVGFDMSIDQIMVVWSDASHMIPAVTASYCHIGAGVAKAGNGMTYYVLQAAYTAGKSCGDYTSPPDSNPPPSGNNGTPARVPGIIIPVKTAEPDAEGKIYHEVKAGQSFWAIAIAYHVTIADIEFYNNISRETKLQPGQKLFIPSSSTQGYATPTPVGMVVASTPDADGKIVHAVQPYQTLITIAEAYHITVDKILALNGIQKDWPLQIGQKLLISPGNVTPSPTPRPLTPIEKLTPAADGNYYHVVQEGESLSWIAGLYKISVSELIAWNGLSYETIIRPNQKLLLQVTPPATATPTPGPATATPTVTLTPRPATPTRTPLPKTPSPTATSAPIAQPGGSGGILPVLAVLGILAAGGVAFGLVRRKKI
jgi:LysM repeat protein/uncharacterized protein YkwD